jgi:ATP-dependent Zn protease
MASNGNKDPIGNLMDKLRSLFGSTDHLKNKTALPPKARFSIWYALAVILLFAYLQQYFFSAKVEMISYSQFKQYITEGKVVKLTIGPERINGILKGNPEQGFTTVRVNDPGLVKEMDECKVSYSGWYENKFLSSLLSWILPLGVFFLIWRFAMKKMGPGMGVMSFSKSKAKIFAESDTKVSFADAAGIDEAIDRVVAGLQKKNRVMNPQEKEIVAFHESGHAIVAESVEHADPVHKISIIPRGISALGYTQQQPTEDRYLMTRSELLDRLAVLLGGRVAEELVFKEISTGAQNDLQRATDIARSMVTEYGMSDRLGLVSYERPRQPIFLPESFAPGKNYSEAKAAQIDEEVTRFVEEAHQRVCKILSERRTVLDDLAHLLSEKESVQEEELRQMLSAASPGIAATIRPPDGQGIH